MASLAFAPVPKLELRFTREPEDAVRQIAGPTPLEVGSPEWTDYHNKQPGEYLMLKGTLLSDTGRPNSFAGRCDCAPIRP